MKNKTKKKNTGSYVQRSTVWKAVGGGFSNPGASKIIKVGNHKILLERSEKLNMYGNPVHKATYVDKDGTLGKSYRSTGSATDVVCETLRRNNVAIKHRRIFPKRSKI